MLASFGVLQVQTPLYGTPVRLIIIHLINHSQYTNIVNVIDRYIVVPAD